jgi:HlyD family secretion protein
LDAAIERARSAQLAASAQQSDALARRELASSNMRRNQELADQHFISSGALESFIQTKASADATLDSARANAMGATQDLNRARADRAALLQQRANVRLLAPSDAVVAAREAEPGSTLVAGQAVLRLIDPASLWLSLRVDQGRSAGLAQGLKARVILRSQPQLPLAGTVARVELLADSVTEERIAQVAFDHAPPSLAVGEMAEATIELAPIAPSLILPAASIQRQGSSTGVWRMESGLPVFVPVKLGVTSLDGQVQIVDGLQGGDEIVVYSQKPLTAGARLQVVDAIVAAATGAPP